MTNWRSLEHTILEMQSVANKGDHDVLKAFANRQSHQSKKLSTDGETLHGNWMGGHSIAKWDGDKVRLRSATSRSEQAVHRALTKKHLAPASVHEDVPVEEIVVIEETITDEITPTELLHGRTKDGKSIEEVIVNSNSSGQGYDADHSDHEHHATIVKHGYKYSHSTPIHHRDGSVVNHHTYKHVNNVDKNVSVHKANPKSTWHEWHTSTGGSGHPGTRGMGTAQLDKHLKGRKIPVKEEAIEETSKAKAKAYLGKAVDTSVALAHNQGHLDTMPFGGPNNKNNHRQLKNRVKGIKNAIKRVSEETQAEKLHRIQEAWKVRKLPDEIV